MSSRTPCTSGTRRNPRPCRGSTADGALVFGLRLRQTSTTWHLSWCAQVSLHLATSGEPEMERKLLSDMTGDPGTQSRDGRRDSQRRVEGKSQSTVRPTAKAKDAQHVLWTRRSTLQPAGHYSKMLWTRKLCERQLRINPA